MIVRLATSAMGTRFELVLAGEDEVSLRAAGEEALAEIEEWDQRLSLFRPDSLVSHVNRNAATYPVRLDGDTFDLFAFCSDVYEQSSGAFDISVAPLMRALGFHESDSDGDLDRARNNVGFDGVVLDESDLTIRFTKPGVAIDLGAVGKGHAIDLAVLRLREAAVTSALIHGGSSAIAAIGAPPESDGWTVKVRDPNVADASRWPCVSLSDSALAVSAQHGRTVSQDGIEIGHVLDPRTGEPVRQSGMAAVVTSSARTADAWSTALLAIGRRPDDLDDTITTLIRDESQIGGYRLVGNAAAAVSLGDAAASCM